MSVRDTKQFLKMDYNSEVQGPRLLILLPFLLSSYLFISNIKYIVNDIYYYILLYLVVRQ